MTERAATNIPVDPYTADLDFDEWVETFEAAVEVATNPADVDRKHVLCKKWLPIKLDDRTRKIYNNCAKGDAVTWTALKAELKRLLVSPEEKYNWRSGRIQVVWDGKESFHALGTRVTRMVDKHEDTPRAGDYFHNFRKALPAPYQQAIDWGANAETLDEAKRLAFKYQTVLAGKEDDDSARGATATKSVGFIGAAKDDDRLKAIELTLQGMSLRLGNLEEEQKKITQTTNRDATPRRDYRSPSGERPRNGGYRSYGSPGRPRDSYDRSDRRDSRERYRSRNDSYDRSRRDGRDRPDDRGYGRNDSWGRDNRSRDRDRGGYFGRSPDRGRGYSDRSGYSDRRPSPGRGSPWRRDGYSRNGGPDQRRQDRETRPDNQSSSQEGQRSSQPGSFRSGDLEENFKWFCAAVLEKEERERSDLN